MTAIIAIKEKNRIYVGADGRCSNGVDMFVTENKEQYKVARVNGSPNCLIASSGKSDRNDIIASIPNLLDKKDDVTYEYLVNKTLPKIYKYLESKSLIVEGDVLNKIDSSIVLATKSHLFWIDGCGFVTECNNAAAIGIGKDMLICKYTKIKDENIPAVKKVEECLKHAIKYGQSIGYPIIIAENSADSEFIVINE
ncbi:MAG: hypothetical protein MJ228_04185 [Bacilli bacterium]|nr:hypothetical protein [Bacilli bacterium]